MTFEFLYVELFFYRGATNYSQSSGEGATGVEIPCVFSINNTRPFLSIKAASRMPGGLFASSLRRRKACLWAREASFLGDAHKKLFPPAPSVSLACMKIDSGYAPNIITQPESSKHSSFPYL